MSSSLVASGWLQVTSVMIQAWAPSWTFSFLSLSNPHILTMLTGTSYSAWVFRFLLHSCSHQSGITGVSGLSRISRSSFPFLTLEVPSSSASSGSEVKSYVRLMVYIIIILEFCLVPNSFTWQKWGASLGGKMIFSRLKTKQKVARSLPRVWSKIITSFGCMCKTASESSYGNYLKWSQGPYNHCLSMMGGSHKHFHSLSQ